MVQELGKSGIKESLENIKEDQSQLINPQPSAKDNEKVEIEPREPILLDKDVFDFLRDEHYRTQKIKTNSSDYLIRMFDIMRVKAREMKKKEKGEQKKMTKTGMTVQSKEAQERLYRTVSFREKKQIDQQQEDHKKYDNRI